MTILTHLLSKNDMYDYLPELKKSKYTIDKKINTPTKEMFFSEKPVHYFE